MNSIRGLGLSENTLVVFTSDNGPWTVQKLNGGTGGLFQQGKGTTWEGGLRMVSGERERRGGGGEGEGVVTYNIKCAASYSVVAWSDTSQLSLA